jgi:hypothetical protein
MALFSVAFLGTTPIGGPIVGWISETLGARAGLAVGGVAAAATALVVWLWERARAAPRLDQPADQAPVARAA